MSGYVTKLLLRIIMMRVRNKINPEIAEEQCGFVEGKGTTNAIFILRTLIERALEIQKDVFLCFLDYTKAFDRVHHDEIMKELKKIKYTWERPKNHQKYVLGTDCSNASRRRDQCISENKKRG